MQNHILFGLATLLALGLALPAVSETANEAASPAAQEEEEPDVKLNVGDEAPDFALPVAPDAPADAPKRLSDFRGKKEVLVAFYPKAFTPGCTKQLCGYRDDFAKFRDAGVEIVAVSTDNQKKADEFKADQRYPFMVLGDPKSEVVKAYGVKRIMLTMASRQVFLVGKDGKISYIDRNYDVSGGLAPLYDELFEDAGTSK